MLYPPKWYVVLKALTQNILYFEKGTVCRYHTQLMAKISPGCNLQIIKEMCSVRTVYVIE